MTRGNNCNNFNACFIGNKTLCCSLFCTEFVILTTKYDRWICSITTAIHQWACTASQIMTSLHKFLPFVLPQNFIRTIRHQPFPGWNYSESREPSRFIDVSLPLCPIAFYKSKLVSRRIHNFVNFDRLFCF